MSDYSLRSDTDWPFPKAATGKPLKEQQRWLLNPFGLPAGRRPWIGGWKLGAYGVAAVWVQVNPLTGKIADRVVVKHIEHNNDIPAGWWDPMAWSDGINGVGYRDYNQPINWDLPSESMLQQRLTHNSAAPSNNADECPIAYHRGRSDVDKVNRRWRLLTEYCWWGSVSDVIEYYSANARQIPEAFIWYTVEQLVLAAMLMERGSIDPADAVPGWRSIVHRDLKPANTLLTSRNSTAFRHYPRVKLADFGLAVETDRGDLANNPANFWEDVGTPGLWSPGQRKWYRDDGDFSFSKRLGSKTNVWSIRQTVHCMMRLEHQPTQLTYDTPKALTPILPQNYTRRLINFATACTDFSYDARLDLDQCLNMIRNPIVPAGAPLVDNFQGMRDAIPAAPLSRDTNPLGLLMPENDAYRVGLSRNALGEPGQEATASSLSEDSTSSE